MDLMKKQISYNYLFRIILVDLHQNLLFFMAQLVLGSLLFSVRLGSNHFHTTSKYFVDENIKYTKNVNILGSLFKMSPFSDCSDVSQRLASPSCAPPDVPVLWHNT